MIPPVAAHHAPAVLDDVLIDDAQATPHLADPAILRRSKARLAYIRERLGVSTPILSLSPREIEEQVHIVIAKAATDDSVLDEEVAGVEVESEVLAAFDEPSKVIRTDKESSILLAAEERADLVKDLAAHRARFGYPLGRRPAAVDSE